MFYLVVAHPKVEESTSVVLFGRQLVVVHGLYSIFCKPLARGVAQRKPGLGFGIGLGIRD